MRVEIEVKHEWMGDFLFDQSTWQRVSILVTSLREEADVVALCSDNHCHLGHLLGTKASSEELLDLGNFLFQDMGELTFTNAISEIDQVAGDLS
jgi:hypothetical protein